MNPTILSRRPLSPSASLTLTTFFPGAQYGSINSTDQRAKDRMDGFGWGNFMLHIEIVPQVMAGETALGFPLTPQEHDAVKTLAKTNLMYCFLLKTDIGFDVFRHIFTLHEPSGRQVALVQRVSFAEIVASTQP